MRGMYTINVQQRTIIKYSTMDESLLMRGSPLDNGYNTLNIIDKDKRHNAMTKSRLMAEDVPIKRLEIRSDELLIIIYSPSSLYQHCIIWESADDETSAVVV